MHQNMLKRVVETELKIEIHSVDLSNTKKKKIVSFFKFGFRRIKWFPQMSIGVKSNLESLHRKCQTWDKHFS